MDEKEKEVNPTQPDIDLNQLDDQGRRVYDEYGEKIHWASKRDRIVALILALIVIAITIAMAYSISVGDFFRH